MWLQVDTAGLALHDNRAVAAADTRHFLGGLATCCSSNSGSCASVALAAAEYRTATKPSNEIPFELVL